MESLNKAEQKCFGCLAQTLGGTNRSVVHRLCRFVSPLFCEFFGALIITVTIAFTNRKDEGFEAQNALAPLAIGAMLTSMLYSYGHISGAHFNPAVTMAVFVRGKITILTLVKYFCAQIAGAVAGASISVRVIGENYLPVMAIDTARVTIGDAFLLEFLYTYALCTTVLNTATTASLHGNQFYGLAIGFVVLAAATSIGPVTGAALSPAFATAFCVIHRSGGGILWMYWISELLAGFSAAIIFHVTNNEEADLRFLQKDTVQRHAAAVGGHTTKYHEKLVMPWRKTTEEEARSSGVVHNGGEDEESETNNYNKNEKEP